MNEDFFQFLFEYKLLENTEFEIISAGQRNLDAGPDFFNSKIKIGDTIWAGNVEIHVKSSHWNGHGHHKNKAYQNLILHLVFEHDTEVYQADGAMVPTYPMQFPDSVYQAYEKLIHSNDWIHCASEIGTIDPFKIESFIESISIKRLQRKSEYFEQLLNYNETHWDEALYQGLAKGFGGNINAIPFELLAKSLPLKILQKHQTEIFELEALLFGQAGWLEISNQDEYTTKLTTEYEYLKQKYNLKPIRSELWKFSKTRPDHFPTVRLALFAQVFHRFQNLVPHVLQCQTIEAFHQLFDFTASNYWDTHFRLGTHSVKRAKKMSKSFINHLFINTFAPFLSIYASQTHTEDLLLRGLEILEHIPPEVNQITKNWNNLGLKIPNALFSQGLIELKNEHCKKHMCLNCRIGHHLLSMNWKK